MTLDGFAVAKHKACWRLSQDARDFCDNFSKEGQGQTGQAKPGQVLMFGVPQGDLRKGTSAEGHAGFPWIFAGEFRRAFGKGTFAMETSAVDFRRDFRRGFPRGFPQGHPQRLEAKTEGSGKAEPLLASHRDIHQ